MEVKIRKAKIEDLVRIQKLSEELFAADAGRDKWLNHKWSFEKEGEEFFTKKINDNDCICIVAEIDGSVVGYICGEVRKLESWRKVKRAELDNIFVEEKYRGMGIGKKLINKFLKWSKDKGIERAMVFVYATNDRAISFYKQEGFEAYSLCLEIDV